MAWYGTRPGFSEIGLRASLIYWGVFLLFLLVTLYLALLDIRYNLLKFKLGERALFEDTIGNEDLRKELSDGRTRPDESSD